MKIGPFRGIRQIILPISSLPSDDAEELIRFAGKRSRRRKHEVHAFAALAASAHPSVATAAAVDVPVRNDHIEKKVVALELALERLEVAHGKIAALETRLATLQSAMNRPAHDEEKLAALEKRLIEKAEGCAACKEALGAQQKVIDSLRERIDKLEAGVAVAKPPELPLVSSVVVVESKPPEKHSPVVEAAIKSIETPSVWPVLGTPGRAVISYIDFVGTEKSTQGDEFIEIKNIGGMPIDVSGWRIDAGHAGQGFKFATGSILAPGVGTRIYTNAAGAFSFGSKTAIWNDAGDLGQLLDAAGNVVSEYGYGAKETRTIASIKAAYGVENLELIYDQAQVAKQKRKSDRMDFLSALERAIRSLLHDPPNQDTPNAANRLRDRHEGIPKDALPELIERYIRDHLNKNALRLLSEDLPEKTVSKASCKDNWIFLLDKGFGATHWVIVDRTGTKPGRQEII